MKYLSTRINNFYFGLLISGHKHIVVGYMLINIKLKKSEHEKGISVTGLSEISVGNRIILNS